MKKFALILSVIAMSCSQSEEVQEVLSPEIEAEAQLFSLDKIGDDSYDILNKNIGKATFSQVGDIVTLHIQLRGITPNTSKAIHIHNGSISEPGRHWNQQSLYAFCNSRSMGQLWAKPFAGDVGNVEIDADGTGELIIQTDLWALNSGDEKDIIDKIIIVHDDPENFALECDPKHSHDHLHSNLKIGGGAIALTTNTDRMVYGVTTTNFAEFTICK